MKSLSVLFALFGCALPGFACICAVPASPCESYTYNHGSPSFVGEAVAVERVSELAKWNPQQTVSLQKTTFRVEEAFEDVPDEMVTVYGSGTTCDYGFKMGADIWSTAGATTMTRYEPGDALGQLR